MMNNMGKLRENFGFGLSQIAGYLGVTQAYIAEVENDKRVLSVDQMEQLANLYGCSIESLTADSEKLGTINFGLPAQEITTTDLRTIADINRIALNSKFIDFIKETTPLQGRFVFK